MCGIAGYVCFGAARPSVDTIKKLLVGIEPRGKDASGMAWLEGSAEHTTLQIWKSPVAASDFVRDKGWKDFKVPSKLIMHTRAQTQGDAENNANNHPVYNKDGMALVHNGMISNYDWLVKKHKMEMDAEVDTEVLLRLIEPRWWKSVHKLNDVYGSFAVASLWAGRPDDLVLVRHNNPLVLGFDEERNILYWASTATALAGAVAEKKAKIGLEFKGVKLLISELPDDSAMLIGPKGLKSTKMLDPMTWSAWNTVRPPVTPWGSQKTGGWSCPICYGTSAKTGKPCVSCQGHKKFKRETMHRQTDGTARCEWCKKDAHFLRIKEGQALCSECAAEFDTIREMEGGGGHA